MTCTFTIVAGLLFAVAVVACGAWHVILGTRDGLVDAQLATRVRSAPKASADVRLGAMVLAAVTAVMVWLFR